MYDLILQADRNNVFSSLEDVFIGFCVSHALSLLHCCTFSAIQCRPNNLHFMSKKFFIALQAPSIAMLFAAAARDILPNAFLQSLCSQNVVDESLSRCIDSLCVPPFRHIRTKVGSTAVICFDID